VATKNKQAARAVAQARGGSRTAVIVGVVVVAVLAVAVVAAVVLAGKNKTADVVDNAIPVASAGFTGVPVVLDKANGTVLVGKDSAKATLDVYEDFLCPACGQFEKTWAPKIDAQVGAGTLKVRYHLVNLLDAQSKPAGYSTQSANAALALAESKPEKFPDFHASLFAKQPREGAAGYTEDQLVGLGRRLGAGDDYEKSVRGKVFDQAVQANYDKARVDPALQRTQDGQTYFGTPTVASDGKLIAANDPNWLVNLVG
jgi:protein-disulfide isomerase